MTSPRPLRSLPMLVALVLLVPSTLGAVIETGSPVVIRAAAVSETSGGFRGATATISITSAANGSGHVFLDTFPLTEVDMQGSARLAARVASQITGRSVNEHDFFFVVRAGSQQIGGPSAGAAMTVGAAASLEGWTVREDALMTGTINPDGTVGPVGGIAEKATAAAEIGVTRFLFPAGQEVVPLGERVVNMTRYCRDELGIDCIPVADVIDAIGLMTDHAIERPPLRGNVTGDDFRAVLAPLGAELVDEAAGLAAQARAAWESAPASAAKTGLGERLASAEALVARARGEVENGTYYRAASTSFRASIEGHYVREASEVLRESDTSTAAALSLREARETVDRVRLEVESSHVQDTNGFEAIGAAQTRLLEAERRLGEAQTLLSSPRSPQDLFDALYQASYAAERAETAAWWLRLTEGFPRGEPVEAEALAEVARDTITTSTEEVAYVDAVLASAGAGGQLVRSRQLLQEANTAMQRGFYAGAMLAALEASVRASVALEMIGFGGNIPESKFETAREVAGRAIQGARARGVESLLGQSAYEFGITEEEPAERLAFLGYARVTANLAGLPGLFDDARPAASRFQGDVSPFRVDAVYVAAAFAVGIALGVGAGLTAMMPRKPEDDEPVAPPSGDPRST